MAAPTTVTSPAGVRVVREGAVARLTLDRPPANTYDAGFVRAFGAAVDDIRLDEEVRCVLVESASERFFSAGADLAEFQHASVRRRAMTVLIAHEVFRKLEQTPLLFIAVINGHCLGGGFELALACDLIVASEQAKFGLPEVRRGLVAGAGGLLRLPKRIPYHLAMEIALTGEHFPAARLHQAGLVSEIVAAGEALQAARDLAGRVAQGGPLALAATKRIIVESADWDSASAFDRQGEIIAPVFTSADAREGAMAFAEKRQPNWRGE